MSLLNQTLGKHILSQTGGSNIKHRIDQDNIKHQQKNQLIVLSSNIYLNFVYFTNVI